MSGSFSAASTFLESLAAPLGPPILVPRQLTRALFVTKNEFDEGDATAGQAPARRGSESHVRGAFSKVMWWAQ